MNFKKFQRRFGGAARTKNMAEDKPNRRVYSLPPGEPQIPREFIRLCPWEMEYLFTVARRARRGIAEVGRFNGGSLFVMACAAPSGTPIFSVDIEPQNDELLRSLLEQHCPHAKVNLIVGDSQHEQYPQVGPVDLLFIDGDHSYEGCLADLENWYPHLVPGGQLVLHDAYLGGHGVQDAIIDFMKERPELDVIQSPYIGATYWHYPAGSMAHLARSLHREPAARG